MLLWIHSPFFLEKEFGLQILVLKYISECPWLSPYVYILSSLCKMDTWLNCAFKKDSLCRIIWKWIKLRNRRLNEVLNGHKQMTSLGEVMKWRNVMCFPNKELMSQVVSQLGQKQSQDCLKITLITVEKEQQSIQVILTNRSQESSSGLGRCGDFLQEWIFWKYDCCSNYLKS